MGDHDPSRHPLCRAIQQCMDRITHTVVYDDVKDRVFAKELITLQDLDEYDRLPNIEAVRKMMKKVMRSINGCQKFLEVLQQMSQQQQYIELAKEITDKCEQNATESIHATCQNPGVTLQEQLASEFLSNMVPQIVPQEEVDEIMQDCKTLIDKLLKQEVKMKPIVQAMQLKRNASKSFTEFLLYIVKLFLNAIENKTITMKNSARQSIVSELNSVSLVLCRIWKDFNDTEDKTSIDHSVAIVVTSTIKITDIVKSLQQKHWLRWLRSAKNISALVPIFEKITEVVKGIQNIDCRPFCQLIGDIASLEASLVDIEKRIQGLRTVGLATSLCFAVGGVICLIVGGFLLMTPAAPVSLPLAIAGVTGVGVSVATGGATELCNFLAAKRLNRSKVKGSYKGYKFVVDDTTELPQPC